MAEKDIEIMAREIVEGKITKATNKKLTDDELDEVAGGAYTPTIEQIECTICGWISGFFVGQSMDDCQTAILAHRHDQPTCPGSVYNGWIIHSYDSQR